MKCDNCGCADEDLGCYCDSGGRPLGTVKEFDEAVARRIELERKAAAFDAIEQELEQAKADVENLSKDNIALRSQLFGSHFSHRDHVDAIRAELEPRETAYPATLRYWGFKALQLAMDLGVRYDAERDRAEKAERERDTLRDTLRQAVRSDKKESKTIAARVEALIDVIKSDENLGARSHALVLKHTGSCTVEPFDQWLDRYLQYVSASMRESEEHHQEHHRREDQLKAQLAESNSEADGNAQAADGYGQMADKLERERDEQRARADAAVERYFQLLDILPPDLDPDWQAVERMTDEQLTADLSSHGFNVEEFKATALATVTWARLGRLCKWLAMVAPIADRADALQARLDTAERERDILRAQRDGAHDASLANEVEANMYRQWKATIDDLESGAKVNVDAAMFDEMQAWMDALVAGRCLLSEYEARDIYGVRGEVVKRYATPQVHIRCSERDHIEALQRVAREQLARCCAAISAVPVEELTRKAWDSGVDVSRVGWMDHAAGAIKARLLAALSPEPSNG